MATSPKPGPFDESKPYRSLALVVKNRKFYVSRDVLANLSPVFESMLFGNFVEGRQDEVQLPGKKAAEIEEMLLCIIPTPMMTNIKAIDEANVDLMLEFADEYQIAYLQHRCEAFLIEKMAKCENGDDQLLGILRMASKHRMRQLLESCIKRCALDFSLLDLQSAFDGLRPEVVACLALFKNSSNFVQSGTTCKFELTRRCNRRVFQPYHENSGITCLFCDKKHCFICEGMKVEDTPCTRSKVNPDLSAIENCMRALLDRIRP